jgi:hypothetical protein
MMRFLKLFLLYFFVLTPLVSGYAQGRGAALHLQQICSQTLNTEKALDCSCGVMCSHSQAIGDAPHSHIFIVLEKGSFSTFKQAFKAYVLEEKKELFPIEPRAPTFFLV